MRIDDGEGFGQFLARQVVIGDDEIDLIFCRCRLLDGGDAAVHRDDEPGAPGDDLIERFLVQPVAVLLTMRNEVVCSRAELTQIAAEKRGRRDAVDVVIAIDDDALLRLDRLLYARDGLFHILHQERIVKRLLFRMKERPRLFVRCDAAMQKKRRREGRRADALRKFHSSRRCIRQERPFFLHCPPPICRRWSNLHKRGCCTDLSACAQPFHQLGVSAAQIMNNGHFAAAALPALRRFSEKLRRTTQMGLAMKMDE